MNKYTVFIPTGGEYRVEVTAASVSDAYDSVDPGLEPLCSSCSEHYSLDDLDWSNVIIMDQAAGTLHYDL